MFCCKEAGFIQPLFFSLPSLPSRGSGMVTLRLYAGGGLRCFHCGTLPLGPATPAPCTTFHPRAAQAECGPGEVCVALSLPGDGGRPPPRPSLTSRVQARSTSSPSEAAAPSPSRCSGWPCRRAPGAARPRPGRGSAAAPRTSATSTSTTSPGSSLAPRTSLCCRPGSRGTGRRPGGGPTPSCSPSSLGSRRRISLRQPRPPQPVCAATAAAACSGARPPPARSLTRAT